MRKAYENQMVEVEEKPHDDLGKGVYAPDKCETGTCD
jgi:hypothetical protein